MTNISWKWMLFVLNAKFISCYIKDMLSTPGYECFTQAKAITVIMIDESLYIYVTEICILADFVVELCTIIIYWFHIFALLTIVVYYFSFARLYIVPRPPEDFSVKSDRALILAPYYEVWLLDSFRANLRNIFWKIIYGSFNTFTKKNH